MPHLPSTLCPQPNAPCHDACPRRAICGSVVASAAPLPDSPYRIDPYRQYSTKDAAKLLGLAPHTLENWRVKGGHLPYSRLGAGTRGAIRYKGADLIEFLHSGRRRSTSE